MSEQPKDGGPVFPFAPTDHSNMNYIAPGMSLRDWFAGQAAAATIGGLMSAGVSTTENDAFGIARAAYLLADAMLAARTTPEDAIAEVAKLRAERDHWKLMLEKAEECLALANSTKNVIASERDLLAAELAAANAREEGLREAVEALGAMPEGYCFCSRDRIGNDSKVHETECQDIRDQLQTGDAARAQVQKLRADLEAARARDGWQPPEDRPEGYRCLGWTEDGWVVVTWVQMGSDASRWFTDWYPERDDTPTAFAPLPAALAAAPAQNGGGIGPTSLVADQSGKSTFDR